MNCMALSAASVVVLLVVIAVSVVDECSAYSPTSTKFDWSPNRNSQGWVHWSSLSGLMWDCLLVITPKLWVNVIKLNSNLASIPNPNSPKLTN